MDYLREHHRLLQILDESREEEEELSDSLHTLIVRELVSQLTEDINEHHQLELVLDVAKADSSTQDNLEKHLSQLDISQPETTDFSSATPNAPVEFLDIDTMKPLMQSNYNNPLHNPEGVPAETAEAATTNNPPSDCVTQLEIQGKQLSLALAAQQRLASASSSKEAAFTQVLKCICRDRGWKTLAP